MNRKKRTKLERNIIACLQAYRLEMEIEIIESELPNSESTKVEEPAEEKKGILKRVKSFFSSATTTIMKGKNEDDLAQAKSNYTYFISTLPEDISIDMLENKDKFNNLIQAYFEGDEGSAKIGMALELLSYEQDEGMPKFLRLEKSRRALSAFFFDDPNRLGEIGNFFLCSYAEIGSPKPNSFSRGFLYGLATGSIAMLGPRLFIKIFHKNNDGAPVKDLVGGSLKALGASELLALSALVGGGYVSRRKYKRKASKKVRLMVRNCLDTEIAYSFATAITMWQFSANSKNENNEKEELDLILNMVSDIRSDCEYLAVVEQANKEENLKKVIICNNAISYLASLR